MGTMMLACGCMVSSSMFGDHEIMTISACPHHATNQKLQVVFRILVEQLRSAYDQDPGHWEEDGWHSEKNP